MKDGAIIEVVLHEVDKVRSGAWTLVGRQLDFDVAQARFDQNFFVRLRCWQNAWEGKWG